MSSRRSKMRNYKTNFRERRRKHNYYQDYQRSYGMGDDCYPRIKDIDNYDVTSKLGICAFNFSIMF